MTTELVEKNVVKDRENKELIRKYRETGDEQSKEDFFRKNSKLSYFIARKYESTGIQVEELASIADFGMLKAFNTFNLDKDVRFATYATRCMHNEILMFLRRNKKHASNISLEGTVTTDADGSELTWEDVTEAVTSNEIDQRVDREALRELVEEIKRVLKPRELVIFENMMTEDRITQRDIAEKLGISQSYLSRLEKRISGKARKVACKIGLEHFTKLNTSYDMNQPRRKPQPEEKKEIEESPVTTYTIKELVKMEHSKIKVEGKNAKEKIEYLMDNYEGMSVEQMALLAKVSKNTARTYRYTILGERKQQRKASKPQKQPVMIDKEKVVLDTTLTEEELRKMNEALNEPVKEPEEKPTIEEFSQNTVGKVVPEESAPKGIELALADTPKGVALQILAPILSNLQDGRRYSIVISIDEVKDPVK